MGKSVNQVFLIGRLTRDVELRSTPTGKNVASFTLAVDRQGEGADFIDCTAWDKTAELVSQYLVKGSKVHVQGRLNHRTWEQDGQKRSKVEVVAYDVTFLDSKTDSENNNQTNTVKKDEVIEDTGDEPINLDDIPF